MGLWFQFVSGYSDEDFHKAIMHIVENTNQLFPGTNVVAMLRGEMDTIIKKREDDIKQEIAEKEQTDRKLLAQQEAIQRVIEAEEAEKRLVTPEYQESLRKLDGDFREYMKEMTIKTMAHCDKFIDKSNAPLDPESLKVPWTQDRIEQTRKKLRAETLAKQGENTNMALNQEIDW